MSARLALLAMLCVAAACTAPSQQAVPVAQLDEAAYVRDVHPILEARCATLDCHGAPGRALRLYAETGLRASDPLRGQPITAAELAADVRAASAIDPAAATVGEHLLLTKPLARAAGGVEHVGGELWASRTDPQLVCVAGWLAGDSDRPDVVSACAAAAEQVRLPDP